MPWRSAFPTIASRVGGNPEIVRHGESGLLFAKGDAAGLADRGAPAGGGWAVAGAAGRGLAAGLPAASPSSAWWGEMADFLASPR